MLKRSETPKAFLGGMQEGEVGHGGAQWQDASMAAVAGG